MSTLLTAKSILDANDLTKEKVEVPEWSGHLFVRVMPGYARDAWEAHVFLSQEDAGKRMKNLRARLIAATACDEQGNLLFNEKQIEALGKKSSKAMDRVFEAASRLNGLTKEDVDSLVGESEGDQNLDSGTD